MSGFSNSTETGGKIAIKDEGLSLSSGASSIDFAGAGVIGTALGDEVTETIAGGGGSPETPTGTIDGANKVFTVTATSLSALFLNGIFQEKDVLYTFSGTTITYVTAPRVGMSHVALVA